ncbi:protoheme IX farnesyltransferase [Breoghania corrubedonensis]|uniref:Protoheme IX farnesyltransferase n=1 Tax=Breoghania corrubedonensis TaxID=665038 RepID=A0A2T5VET0_9HYPH|nr:heme o synthase [Breoghania corrubedonensis]PTW62264.1 protoheme IX farnesyltransferase [Breoghania corrubedonensis]
MSLVERHDSTTAAAAAWDGGTGSVGDYFALLKPRVMSLVIFTALVGIVLAPGGLHPVLAGTALLCIAIGAGASGALNMWYDADIDRVMTRTAKRPVPAGRVTGDEAFAFGMTLACGSVLMIGLAVNLLAAGLLAFTIFFYVVVYTMWLKRSTPQNIVIGGAAGALPPVIGWAAVTGSVSLESIVLFLIIFMWTPPHFWALALFKSADYEAAGVPMLPVVRGAQSTRNHILVYSLLLAPVGLTPTLIGLAGPVYGVAAMALGAVFVWLAVDVWRRREGPLATRAAVRLFLFSIFYLFALFALLLAERLVTLAFSGALFGWGG